MNSQENRDRRLEELEQEIEQTVYPYTEGEEPQLETKTIAWLNRARNWFENLPNLGKVGVIVLGAMVGVSILSTLFQLVTSLLSIAILGIIVYFLYKKFLAARSAE
jgi:hypothetical protein